MNTGKTRWDEIREIWADNQWPLVLLTGWMLGLLTIPAIRILSTDIADFLLNLVPEAVGIGFTVLILDRLNEIRARQQLQERLVREASGQANETAKAAVDWMHAEGWLAEPTSLLQGKDLTRANLAGADLWRSNLQKTNFYKADLNHANMYRVDLRNANLAITNLTGADLIAADLRGANLQEATIEGVLWYHENQEGALLPDGSRWTPESDLSRFTDPTHPEFWRSTDEKSPTHPSYSIQGKKLGIPGK